MAGNHVRLEHTRLALSSTARTSINGCTSFHAKLVLEPQRFTPPPHNPAHRKICREGANADKRKRQCDRFLRRNK
jgi:hypothetical protein